MNIVSWTPFREMEGIFDRYNRLLEKGAIAGMEGKEFDWRPTADISEAKDHYMIKAVLPEVEKDDVNVSIENGVLTISGERRYEKKDESETQHRVESMYGSFQRSFTLPSDVDESKISAESKNGVLKVRLPKTELATPKSISVSID